MSGFEEAKERRSHAGADCEIEIYDHTARPSWRPPASPRLRLNRLDFRGRVVFVTGAAAIRGASGAAPARRADARRVRRGPSAAGAARGRVRDDAHRGELQRRAQLQRVLVPAPRQPGDGVNDGQERILQLFNYEALTRPRYAYVVSLQAMGPLMIRFVIASPPRVQT
jgi:hypothetical protein